MLDNYPDVLSFRQVMEITHVGRNLLLRLLNSGEIPAFKMGKLWKVYKQDLIQYMSQCQWAISFVCVKRIPLDSATRIQRDLILLIFNALARYLHCHHGFQIVPSWCFLPSQWMNSFFRIATGIKISPSSTPRTNLVKKISFNDPIWILLA